jgi:hypothetical protein
VAGRVGVASVDEVSLSSEVDDCSGVDGLSEDAELTRPVDMAGLDCPDGGVWTTEAYDCDDAGDDDAMGVLARLPAGVVRLALGVAGLLFRVL